MVWLITGLFVVGTACGTAIRLMIFVGILVAAALISTAATAPAGAGAMTLIFILTVVTLQIGYVAGFMLRGLIHSRYPGIAR